MNIGQSISHIFHKVISFFESDKVKHVEDTLAELLPFALTAVEQVNTFIGGNKTLENVIALANHYGVPLANAELSNNTLALNNELMSIGGMLLQKALPSNLNGTQLNMINSAINLAVSLVHA